MDKLVNEYNQLFDTIQKMFPDIELTSNISRVDLLVNSLKNQTNFNLFLKSKIKVFSHKENDTTKISESLFGKSLTLKKIFNNQDDNVKYVLWTFLHRIVLFKLESFENPDKNTLDRIQQLKDVLTPTKKLDIDPKETFKNLLKTDQLNTETNDLINDIFGSFENSLNSTNPLDNLLNISSTIGEKYKDQIENGDIDLNQLLDGLQNNLPGMGNMKKMIEPLIGMVKNEQTIEPEKVIIDENFSTANVDLGKQEENNNQFMLGNMLKTFSPDLLNNNKLFGALNKLQNMNPQSTTDDISELFKNDLGMDINEITEQMNQMLEKNK
jgi:hypothetical protein